MIRTSKIIWTFASSMALVGLCSAAIDINLSKTGTKTDWSKTPAVTTPCIDKITATNNTSSNLHINVFF